MCCAFLCQRIKQGLPKFANHSKFRTWPIGLTFCAFIVVERFLAYAAVSGNLLQQTIAFYGLGMWSNPAEILNTHRSLCSLNSPIAVCSLPGV